MLAELLAHPEDITKIVESLSATLWAFLLTVTKVSRYVPYDLLVK